MGSNPISFIKIQFFELITQLVECMFDKHVVKGSNPFKLSNIQNM